MGMIDWLDRQFANLKPEPVTPTIVAEKPNKFVIVELKDTRGKLFYVVEYHTNGKFARSFAENHIKKDLRTVEEAEQFIKDTVQQWEWLNYSREVKEILCINGQLQLAL